MAKGLEMQFPLIAKLRSEGKVKVETMEASGLWFKAHYKVTPSTSFAVTKDLESSNLKTVWFNSRFYRINILWENGALRIRDIHLFDESYPDVYTKEAATSNECTFFTLPVVDSYIWSKPDQIAGLRLKALINGKEVLLKGNDPKFTNRGVNAVHISWPLTTIAGSLEIDLSEKTARIQLLSKTKCNWYLDLTTIKEAKLPFRKIGAGGLDCNFDGMNYQVNTVQGSFSKPENGAVFRLKPQLNVIALDFAGKK